MRKFIFLVLISLAHGSQAQHIQSKINEQVWKPFISSFNQHQSDAFLAIHSKDLVRSARDSRAVLNWDDYLRETKAGDQRDKDAGYQRVLELRFTERLNNTQQAIDVGVYKTTYAFPDGKTQTFYGRFHVVLRLESGVWKILVDTDSSENGTISEKSFLAARPLE